MGAQELSHLLPLRLLKYLKRRKMGRGEMPKRKKTINLYDWVLLVKSITWRRARIFFYQWSSYGLIPLAAFCSANSAVQVRRE